MNYIYICPSNFNKFFNRSKFDHLLFHYSTAIALILNTLNDLHTFSHLISSCWIHNQFATALIENHREPVKNRTDHPAFRIY